MIVFGGDIIDSGPTVFSWLVIALEGDKRADFVMSKGLWERLIIKYAPDVTK